MNLHFFSRFKLFRIKGNNNVLDSSGVDIDINNGEKPLSEYCKKIINELLEETEKLSLENTRMNSQIREMEKKIQDQNRENKRLAAMLMSYIDEHNK